MDPKKVTSQEIRRAAQRSVKGSAKLEGRLVEAGYKRTSAVKSVLARRAK